MKVLVKGLLGAVALAGFSLPAYADTTLTIGTVNNGDMIRMQGLTEDFTKANPDIKLNWVTLEENVLRQKVTTDIATKGGQFDVLTIGTYETPIWAKKKWLVPLDKLGADYDVDDLLAADPRRPLARRQALCRAVLRRKLFYHVPHGPDGEGRPQDAGEADLGFHRQAADKMTDKPPAIYGICLRGKPGWGENMAFLTATANSFGARWFDEKWQPQFNTPEWKKTLNFYVALMKAAGPPGASVNGFNENLALFNDGKCGMWIDATVAGRLRDRSKAVEGRRQSRFRAGPGQGLGKRGNWLWAWSLGDSGRHEQGRRGREVHLLGDEQALHRTVASKDGWAARPAGHAHLALQESGVSESGALCCAHARSRSTRPTRPIRR